MDIKYKCIKKILENINLLNNGCIIASPSKSNPDYYYHWIRDSALTMRVIVNEYSKTFNLKYLEIILKYVNTEYELINLNTLSGLGEPKFNVDKSTFDENWGRPQFDGPALRGLVMIKIANLLKKDFKYIVKSIINKIIERDMLYTFENLNKPCFDIWEEKLGYHFYTRIVIAKFTKEYNNYKNINNINCFTKIKELIDHHVGKDKIISSFDIDGNVLRENDSSIFMCLNHIDYDNEIFNHENYNLVSTNISELKTNFNNKYKKEYNMVGRYIDDKYFNGHIWFICTIGMIKFMNNYNKKIIESDKLIINKIINIDEDFNIAEQYNPDEDKFYSAKKLTWNYTELYFYFN
jgi:glucoamylase